MKPSIFTILLFFFSFKTFAWHWEDLWLTRDQQGARYLKQQAYKEAQHTFKQPDWQAAAAYRAKDFEAASTTFGQLNTADGYYNQGNAKAQLEQYLEALQAYQKSLAIRPNDADTLHNKKIVEELLKQQQNNDKTPQDQPPQQDNDKTPQDQPSQQDNDKTPQDQPSQQDNDKTPQDQPSQQDNDKTKEQSLENQQHAPSNSNAEDYQSTEQWLNMIPDDPGGLLRQKFLRDHRRRANGAAP